MTSIKEAGIGDRDGGRAGLYHRRVAQRLPSIGNIDPLVEQILAVAAPEPIMLCAD